MRSRLTVVVSALLVTAGFLLGASGISSGSSEGLVRLVIFLEIAPDALDGVELQLETIAVHGPTPSSPLLPELESWRSSKLRGRSLRLLDATIAPGRLDSLSFHIGEITAPLLGAPVHPSAPEGGVVLPLEGRRLRAGDAILIRLQWIPRAVDPDAESYFVELRARGPSDVPPGTVAFVSNEYSDYISVIDVDGYQTVDVLSAARGPRDLAYSPLDQRLYCALSASDELLLVDTNSRAILHKLPLNYGDEPSRLAFSPDFQTIYVLNLRSHSVSGINVNSLQEVMRMQAGTQPRDIAVDPGSGFIYISTDLPGQILAIDPLTRTEASRFAVDPSPSELAVDPGSGLLLVASEQRRRILVFDLSSGTQRDRIPLCSPARGLAFARSQGRLLATAVDCQRVEIIVPAASLEAGWLSVDGRPGRLSLGAQSRRIFVTLPELKSIQVFNLGSLQALATVPVGEMPHTVLMP